MLREASLNVTNGGVRTLLISVVLAAVLTMGGMLEAHSVQQIVERDVDLARRGRFVLQITPGSNDRSPLDARACERLVSQDGVTASGSVLDNDLLPLRLPPGSTLRRIAVTPGLYDVFNLTAGNDSGTALIFAGHEAADESREPVGSSANTTEGSWTSDRATAARCRSPPETSAGCRSPSRSISDVARSSLAALAAADLLSPINQRGRATFSRIVSSGNSSPNWNTTPIRSRRIALRRRSIWLDSVMPSKPTVPPSGTSKPIKQCKSVDFPEPDGPTMASACPA